MPLIVNNKEVKKLMHDGSGLEVLEMKDSSGKLLHKRVNLEFMIDEFRPYTETIDTWGTIMDVPDDPILENTPTIYLVGWSYDGVNALPEPIRVPIEDSTLYAIWSDALVNIFNLDIGTRVRLNSKSTNAVVIGSTVTLEPNFKKGVDGSSGNINKYINTETTFKHTSSNEVKLSNNLLSLRPHLLRGEDFSVGSLDLGTSMVSVLDIEQGTFNTFNESISITLDKFEKGKDVSYSDNFNITSTDDLLYDSRMGISLNEVIKNNPLSMMIGEDFSISLSVSNIGVESELDTLIGGEHSLSSVTGLSLDKFIRGKDVNYSGSVNLLGEDIIVQDLRMGIRLNESIVNQPITLQKGADVYVNLNSSTLADMSLDTYLQNGKRFNIISRPNVSNLNVSVSGAVTNTPTIRYVICDQGNIQVGLRNNDSSPVTMYLKTGSTFYSVGTQVQPGATLIYTVNTGISGNYYYNNWIAKAKAADKEMSGETAPVSGSVSCPVAQLKWVYAPNHQGFGIPSFDNPEGKTCSVEGSYISYEDPNFGIRWFRCTKV